MVGVDIGRGIKICLSFFGLRALVRGIVCGCGHSRDIWGWLGFSCGVVLCRGEGRAIAVFQGPGSFGGFFILVGDWALEYNFKEFWDFLDISQIFISL